jgi:hypothetical protein
MRARTKTTLWMAGLLLALLLAVPAGAAADVTMQDNIVKVVLQGAQTTSDGDVFVGTLTPSFLVEPLLDGATVQCHVDFEADGPCGAPVSGGSLYTPSLTQGGFHFIRVDYEVPGGGGSYLEFQFNADATPPDTVMHLPPAPEESLLPSVSANQHPQFDVSIRDDFLTDNDSFQCTLSLLHAAPGAFHSCDPSKPLPRLRLTSTYLYRVRTVDFLGRLDPTPAQYVFSPTPCRPSVIGHVRSLSAIAAHRLRVRVACVQPGRFIVQLALPLRETENLHLPSQVLAQSGGRMRLQGQRQLITLHLLRGIPAFLFRIPLRVDVVANETQYGAPGTAANVFAR